MSIESMEAPQKPTKSNEWYTPARYVEAAREVMGGIDLDPASCALANETVQAAWYYDEAINGLEQRWYGRVWLNPPYYSPVRLNPHGPWSVKLIEEYQRGNVEQAVFLVMGGTYNRWFQRLWDYPICFTDHKIYFDRPGKCHRQLRDSNSIVYLGPNEDRFITVFSQFGTVARRVNQEPA